MSTDAFVRSPKGKYFVIDTKSNLGRVFFDGSVLMRRYGKQVYEFNNGKDLLRAVNSAKLVNLLLRLDISEKLSQTWVYGCIKMEVRTKRQLRLHRSLGFPP